MKGGGNQIRKRRTLYDDITYVKHAAWNNIFFIQKLQAMS